MIRHILYFNLLIFLFACKTTEKSTIKKNVYFEVLKDKSLTRGHYSPYFIIDGKKDIIRINTGNEELIFELEKLQEDNILIDNSNIKDVTILIVKGKDEYYKVFEGIGELSFLKSDKLEIKLGVKGNTNVWLQEDNTEKGEEKTIEYSIQEIIYQKEEVQAK